MLKKEQYITRARPDHQTQVLTRQCSDEVRFPLLQATLWVKIARLPRRQRQQLLFAEVKYVEEDGEGEGRGGGVDLGLAVEPALLPLPRVRGSLRLPLGERSKAH